MYRDRIIRMAAHIPSPSLISWKLRMQHIRKELRNTWPIPKFKKKKYCVIVLLPHSTMMITADRRTKYAESAMTRKSIVRVTNLSTQLKSRVMPPTYVSLLRHALAVS